MKLKFQLILRPLFFVALSIILGYSLMVWLVLIPNQLFGLEEELIYMYIPMALPWIPLYFLMSPRFKLLKPKSPKANLNFGLIFFSGLTIFITTSFTQEYLRRAAGKMQHLQTINEFEKKGSPQYCTLQNKYIWNKKYGHSRKAVVSSKGSRLTYYIYFTLPIFETAADTVNEECSYWLSVSYNYVINNRISREEKAKKYMVFNKKVFNEIRETNFNQFEYLEKQGNTSLRRESENAVRQSLIVRYKEPIFFKASKEPFENRFGHLLLWNFLALIIGGSIVWLFILLHPFKTENPEEFSSLQMETMRVERPNLSFFKPHEGFFSTPILVYLNLAVFLCMVFSGAGLLNFNILTLMKWGANYKPAVAQGEWWRLLSNTFVHAGVIHLCFNVAALLYIGRILEPLLGRVKFTLIYLIIGILASICSIAIHPHTVSVGASGAIFGMYGLFLALLMNGIFPKAINKAFLINTFVFVGMNLLFGLTGNVDNAAHIGGLLSGILIGFLILSSIQNKIPEGDEALSDKEL